MKNVLRGHGVRTPAMQVVRQDKTPALESMVKEFQTRYGDFVVKGNRNHAGNEVRMFDEGQVDEAVEYIQDLHGIGSKVFLEDRVKVLTDGRNIDWNIRGLVTGWDDVQWVDGEVRYQKRNGRPVNVCQGSEVMPLALWKPNRIDIAGIKQIALDATKAVMEEIREYGIGGAVFAGVDIALDKFGPTVWEVNLGSVGGPGTLMGLYKDAEVMRGLVESFGPFLASRAGLRGAEFTYAEPTALQNHFMGEAFGSMEEWEVAKAHYERALEIESLPPPHFGLGYVADNLEQHKTAVEQYEKGLALQPTNVLGHSQLARNRLFVNDLEGARVAASRALHFSPDDKNAKSSLISALCQLGNHNEALELLDGYAGDDYHNHWRYMVKGEIHFRARNWPKAAKCFIDAANLKPDNVGLWERLAKVYFNLDEPEEAVVCYEQILSHEPESPEIAYNLGVILACDEKLDGALEMFLHALEVLDTAPKDVQNDLEYKIMANIAEILKEGGYFEEAEEYVRKGLETSPNSPVLLSMMGELCYAKDDLVNCARFYQAARDADPELDKGYNNAIVAETHLRENGLLFGQSVSVCSWNASDNDGKIVMTYTVSNSGSGWNDS